MNNNTNESSNNITHTKTVGLNYETLYQQTREELSQLLEENRLLRSIIGNLGIVLNKENKYNL